MTVSSTTNKIQYAGGTGVTSFAYNFKIFEDEDLTVIVTDSSGTETTKTLTSDYTVTGAGESSGGNVIMGAVVASGSTLTIKRVLDLVQETAYSEGGPFQADTFENSLDRQTMIAQQHDETLGRCFKLSETASASVDPTLPSPQAGYAPAWNDDEDGLENRYLYTRQHAVFWDQKAQSGLAVTNGGTVTGGAWATRDLNTEHYNAITGCSLSSSAGIITVPAGTYIISWAAPAFAVDNHIARLYSVTSTTAVAYGTSEFTENSGGVVQTSSRGIYIGTFSVETQLTIQHYCSTSKVDNGFGVGVSVDWDSIYTQVSITKIG